MGLEFAATANGERCAMKWVKRACWVIAWGAWAWLGVGLYRELPRELGAVVCELPLNEREWMLGFIGDSSLFATGQNADDPNVGARIRIWNGETGVLMQEFIGPIGSSGWDYYIATNCTHIVTVKRQTVDGRRPVRNVSVLDLARGTWIDLAVYTDAYPIFNDEKPWVAFAESAETGRTNGQVLVYDLRTGSKMFRWTPKRNKGEVRDAVGQTFFIGENIGVSTQRHLLSENEENWDDALEIWPVKAASAPTTVVRPMRINGWVHVSPTGRLALGSRDQSDWVDVFDLTTQTTVLQYRPAPPPSFGGRSHALAPGPTISRDGRIVCGPAAEKLWDIDEKREIWTKRPGQRFIDWDRRTRFTVQEDWSFFGYRVFGSNVYAVREAHSGVLVYRCRALMLGAQNSNGTLHMDYETRSIRRMPPRVNWPLHAVCQLVLALPLVILWAVLRYRRLRRARVAAGAEA